jgi:hypothetical protein
MQCHDTTEKRKTFAAIITLALFSARKPSAAAVTLSQIDFYTVPLVADSRLGGRERSEWIRTLDPLSCQPSAVSNQRAMQLLTAES